MRISRLLVAAGAVCVLPITVTEVTAAQRSDSASQQSIGECGRSIRTAASRRENGRALSRGGFLAFLASIPISLSATSRDYRTPPDRTRMQVGHYLGLAGLGAQISGMFWSSRSGTSVAEWDDALQHLNVGQSTAAEVEACLGNPAGRTTSMTTSETGAPVSETSWEYRARTRNSYFGKSTSRVVTIAFRDNVVSGIKITETR
jgi:hypothetical protein